jgi:2-polyprenyl-3-methyl-5-hydroxy-6-metoxy-1,4-benzoquinol methylase
MTMGERGMRFVKPPLRRFDFDAHALRGDEFYASILRYRAEMLERYRGRIQRPEEYRCLLCQGREGSLLIEWEAGYQVIQCARCDFSTANLAIEDEEKHIAQTYTTELYNQYFQDDYVAQFEYRKSQMGAERYHYLIERLDLVPKVTSVLDVGCGSGTVLAALQDRGVTCRGLDVNPGAVAFCRSIGLDVAQGELADEPDASYDVVTMFDVIEHLADPVAVLGTAMRKLKPGGYLVAFTPNIHSVSYAMMGSAQNTLLPFEHVGFFSAKAFDYAAAQIGATVHTLDVFGLDVMDYLLMKEHEDGHPYTVRLREMTSWLQACVDGLGLGNHFRVTFRKGR